MSDRNIFRGLNSIKFHNRFKDENDCLIYLSEIKWASGYNLNAVVMTNSVMEKTIKIGGVQNVVTMKAL
ncbi:hypothetical protein [Flavobacterium sp.]|uniref:hypothetical protein n=1 Tax=Flavobacterium sp. TaxID=239 RepID=UPI0038FC3302